MPIMKHLALRRNCTSFSAEEITQSELGSCLYSGFGIQKYLHVPFRPEFPLKLSPSFGGLNAIHAEVFVRSVESLEEGCYKYYGATNQLIRKGNLPTSPLDELFAKQRWAERAAAIIVMVVNFKQVIWRTADAGVYNSVILEAGHIGQTIATVASSLSIATAPSTSMSRSAIEDALGLDFPTEYPLYAMGIGFKDLTRTVPGVYMYDSSVNLELMTS
jgi:SagB-type dehydrogenase family enzyme